MVHNIVSKSDELIERLKAFIRDAGRGAQSELARELGVHRQRTSSWLGGQARPGLEDGLRLQEILRKAPKRKRKT